MAYRIKGILTLKQRNELTDYLESYQSLTSDESIPATAELLKEVLQPIAILCSVALYVDNIKIQEKVLSR